MDRSKVYQYPGSTNNFARPRNTAAARKSLDDSFLSCSPQSIVAEMERFVQSVNNMNETVMVPSRLMDMTITVPHRYNFESGSTPSTPVELTTATFNLAGSDMHNFYTMLNSMKTELIYGTQFRNANHPLTSIGNNRQRRLSLVSSQSLNLSDSDTDLEMISASSQASSDSGLEVEDTAAKMADTFRHHLTGLLGVVRQMTDVADLISNKYQEEIGGGVL